MDETLKSALIDAVVAAALVARPDIHIGSKYGGTTFVTDTDAPEAVGLAGGVYPYKDYVSAVFARGAEFDDPHQLLEGNGKLRRHLKLYTPSDLENKDVAGFLAQALAG